MTRSSSYWQMVRIIRTEYQEVRSNISTPGCKQFDRGIRVHILNMGLIENTLTGNLILTVMLAFAEYERGMIVERTQTGKAVAKQNPNFKDGRPPKYTPEQIQLGLMLLEQGKTYKQVKALTSISKSTLIRAKKQLII